MRQQRGGTIVGFILGLLVGLASALAVAAYVNKIPVPFLNKNNTHNTSIDETTETQRNRTWDPNAPLYGKKTPLTPVPPSSTSPSTLSPSTSQTPPNTGMAGAASVPSLPAATAPKPSSDPLGDLARQRSGVVPPVAIAAPPPVPVTVTGATSFDYFVQVGAFRTRQDADAQRARLTMLGWQARVNEREQNGRGLFRVRVGPFARRDDAESLKDKLGTAGIDASLVRVPR